MKIRSDFVTNSSSSSFVISFRNEKEMNASKNKMLKLYSQEIVDQVFDDIANQMVSYDEMKTYLREEIELAIRYKYRWGRHSPYRTRPSEWFKSKEFNELLENETEKEMDNFITKYGHNNIFAIVSYGDDTDEDSALQYDIMPAMPFVYRTISNH